MDIGGGTLYDIDFRGQQPQAAPATNVIGNAAGHGIAGGARVVVLGAQRAAGSATGQAVQAYVGSFLEGIGTSTHRLMGGAGDVVAPTQSAARRSFWNAPTEVNGRRVYQRTDLFDPQAVDANGLTNLQRMQKGRAPIGYDGEAVNLHHVIQLEPGPIAEVGGRFHSQNTKTLHGLVEDGQSFRYSPDGKTTAAEKAFRRWSYGYWQERARGF